ncbi:hypothetical protein [Paenibacillus naphthalenovorans]|uniref:hypothetical protein n=1 Tax=Paenibacillus naphthalenovorans TaxID=162209 RepID=UPI003D2CA4EA
MDLRSILNQITAIRVMLDNIEAEISKEQEQKSESSNCQHRNIKNLTTMGGPDEWICKDCGLHYKEGDVG